MKTLNDRIGSVILKLREQERTRIHVPGYGSITPSELHIIQTIGDAKQITAQEIGNVLSISKGAVSQVVKTLTKSDLIMQSPSEKDKRSKVLTLTELGNHYYECHLQIHHDLQQKLRESLSETEQAGFEKGLDVLLDALHDIDTQYR
ncbi:MarR family transcriptional regulator [Erysipelothrix sp. HDW6C]|uniref:MarR family winged helix-turn-helix transcriptional regulator n=1 Tax=Erysipelothrix sp. HDW6C TaxID=2714930 RepID=UPI00140D20F2|nr:MarR family transcriptional regulator [Erysipelothrix sp. HDW6C]QIK70616.1 MarR family transcriptional regulator [Erysipelothrix sp. HDW6C]